MADALPDIAYTQITKSGNVFSVNREVVFSLGGWWSKAKAKGKGTWRGVGHTALVPDGCVLDRLKKKFNCLANSSGCSSTAKGAAVDLRATTSYVFVSTKPFDEPAKKSIHDTKCQLVCQVQKNRVSVLFDARDKHTNRGTPIHFPLYVTTRVWKEPRKAVELFKRILIHTIESVFYDREEILEEEEEEEEQQEEVSSASEGEGEGEEEEEEEEDV